MINVYECREPALVIGVIVDMVTGITRDAVKKCISIRFQAAKFLVKVISG